jgi:replicative DNA helicase
MKRWLKKNRTRDYIKTKFRDFDKNYFALPAQDLTILAGRSSIGKSMLALQIVLHVARQNKDVIFFSLEMSNNENSKKLIASCSAINVTKLNDKKQYGNEIDTFRTNKNELPDIPLFFDDNAKRGRNYIRKTIRKFKRQHKKVDLIILDHLQISSDRFQNKNTVEELGNITLDFKNIAKQYDC